ncbi:MAG: hypothetical protein Q3983_01075 [Capnocytophaga sp.]|nr:hypothetical protein [Capnocytophaga sp.]
MIRNIIWGIFMLTFIALIVCFSIYDGQISHQFFYFLSFTMMIAGFLLYPFHQKISLETDFLLMPFCAIILVNLINIFWVQNYNETFSLINTIFGLCTGIAFGLKQKKGDNF